MTDLRNWDLSDLVDKGNVVICSCLDRDEIALFEADFPRNQRFWYESDRVKIAPRNLLLHLSGKLDALTPAVSAQTDF